MFPEAMPRETLRSRENKTYCFPRNQWVFCYTSRLKTRKNCEEIAFLPGNPADRFAAVSRSTTCSRASPKFVLFRKGFSTF